MKIYLATPVNGRKEKTLEQKMKAAYQRIREMEEYVGKRYPDAEMYSSFRIVGLALGQKLEESEVMGACVRMVMDCDMIILDDGWENSSGCTVERFVAMQYGKKVQTMNYFKMKDKIG